MIKWITGNWQTMSWQIIFLHCTGCGMYSDQKCNKFQYITLHSVVPLHVGDILPSQFHEGVWPSKLLDMFVCKVCCMDIHSQ